MKHDTPSPTPGLVRALGPFMATAVVVGTVIGSGVFKKPQTVAEHVHSFGLTALVWVAGGVLAFLGALALAEVAVLYPKAGGNYVFLCEGYGRLAGFLWGWVEFWIIRGASLAALATVFSESLHDVLRNQALQESLGLDLGKHPLAGWRQVGLTVLVILALAFVNVRGVRWGGLVQLFITTVKVASLLGILVLPFLVLAWADPTRGDSGEVVLPQADRLAPWWPADWSEVSIGGLFSALLGVLWAYHGWMNIAPVAGEVRRPQRNIPLALLGGVGIIIFLYLGANLAYGLVIPRPEMAEMKATPVATEFSLRLLGPLGAVVASAAVMCSVFGALNGNLLVGPRLLYAMGEDGLAPRALGAVHPRYHTPVTAILVMGGWASGLVVAVALLTHLDWLDPSKSHFDRLTDFAMFGAVIFETMAVASIFVFRWRYPNADRPYRCWGYPVTPALYIVLPALVLGNMFVKQPVEALVGVAFIVLGAAVYALAFRNRPMAPSLPPDGDLSGTDRPAPTAIQVGPPAEHGIRAKGEGPS